MFVTLEEDATVDFLKLLFSLECCFRQSAVFVCSLFNLFRDVRKQFCTLIVECLSEDFGSEVNLNFFLGYDIDYLSIRPRCRPVLAEDCFR